MRQHAAVIKVAPRVEILFWTLRSKKRRLQKEIKNTLCFGANLSKSTKSAESTACSTITIRAQELR